ncbi:sigma factor-like helix-turn-helix DNA-binding protein [Paracoccus angustae]|uniref:Sigma factor-like helix-turn-helix DNA-binding protein n=1 Tax=Paracoccus angustae TaxID=1671480 RepID=A0ABV7U8I6_9RHOB
MLISVLGESYVGAADIMNCDIGTIKSRVSRARGILRGMLAPDF